MGEEVFTMSQLKALQEQGLLATTQKNDPTSAQAYSPIFSGTGWGVEPGVRPGMYSAIRQPLTFIEGVPMMRSEYSDETISILTRQSASAGSNPTDECGVPPYPGDLYKCKQVWPLGRMFVGSKKVNVTEVGLLQNRGVDERVILNYANNPDPLVPDLLKQTGINLRSEAARQLYEMGIAARRAISPVLIDGDATKANTATELGFIQEFYGLSSLVKSGYVDAESSVACTAADSVVHTWNANFAAQTNGIDLVDVITDMVYSIEMDAMNLGFDGFQGEFVMSPRLFFHLRFLFASRYSNVRYDLATAGEPVNRAADAIEARAFQMANTQTLLVGGKAYPVKFTGGSEVILQNSGSLKGDLFFVPKSWSGGPLLYMQYFPMDNRFIQEFNNRIGNTTARTSLNNGLYMAAVRSDGFCDQLIAASRVRMILDAPFLAGRVDDILFPSHIGFKNWDPGGSSYYGGGASLYPTS